MDRYEKKAVKPLENIAIMLGDAEQRMETMELSGDHAVHLREQGKAIRKMKQAVRQAKKVQKLERKSRMSGTAGHKNGLLREDEVLSAIEMEFGKLDIRTANLDSYDAALRTYLQQEKPLDQMKQMLMDAGLYLPPGLAGAEGAIPPPSPPQ